MFNDFRQPHLPQTHVDGSVFLSDELSMGNNIAMSKVVQCRKKLSTGKNQVFKSRPMSQKSVHVQQNQILKVVRCRKKLSTGNKIKF